MKINDSSITFQSEHSLVEQYTSKMSLAYWQNRDSQPGLTAAGKASEGEGLEPVFKGDSVSLSGQHQEQSVRRLEVRDDPKEMTAIEDLNIRLLKALFEKILGKRIRLPDYNELSKAFTPKQAEGVTENVEAGVERVGWGLVYNEYSSYSEKEQLEVKAEGVVLTEDGSKIQIDVRLNLSREFYTEKEISIAMGDALKDPLVVNFSGTPAELTQTKFAFDIDADGKEDQISFVGPGSGFLALDADGDGRISDGKELFGALTGDGFGELSIHDNDKNGWVDENDDIYSRLRIWTRDEQGNNKLFALGEAGIGALYLGNVQSPFSITTSSNELLGQVRSTGIFLHEDGRAGTLQQLDLVV